MDQVEGMLFGRYRVTQHLGDDEAGSVLAAVDVYTGQAYDVRVLWSDHAGDAVRRNAFVLLANEIAAEGEHDHGVQDGHSYIAYPAPDEPPETRRPFPWLAVVGVLVVVLAVFLGVRALGGDERAAVSTTTPTPTSSPTPTVTPIPAGEAGLRHVFPSLSRESVCKLQPKVAGRGAVIECARPGRVLVRYSEWLDVPAMTKHYQREFKGAPVESWTAQRKAIGTVWRPSRQFRKGVWKLAAAYDAHPYSVSVTGPSLAARDAAFRTVEARTAP